MNRRSAILASEVNPQRRSFFAKFAAIVCGGIAALFPFAAAVGVIIDPWRRKSKSAGGENGGKLVPMCPLAALPADGVPRAFPVVADITDAWTHSAKQQIGMIFMSRTDVDGKSNVVAFNAECPHLGCFVDYNPADQHFECPCHKSAFSKDGEKLYGPSRRGLDSLPVKLLDEGGQQEILVAFQKYQKGIAERTPA
jgi:menaquinol-cytochrome c reductase iron-sulfur subunit